MTPKIKIVFGLLAVVALLSVLSFFDTFDPARLIVSAPSFGKTNIALIETDTDHDGLPDTVESYWNTDFQNPDTDGDGFKDGEEVISGYNPNVPSPDDKIDLVGSPKNITTKVGGLVLSGLYEGSLRKNSPNFDKSVNQVVDDTLFQYSANFGEAEAGKLTTISNGPENEAAYRATLQSFLARAVQDIPRGLERLVAAAKTIDGEDYRQYAAFFDSEKTLLAGFVAELEAIPVPQKYTPFHQKTILYLKKVGRTYALIQEGDSATDPIQGVIAASSLTDIVTLELVVVVAEYKNLINL